METPKTNGEDPSWVKISDSSNAHLADMLKFGSENYERQTNWFLHHRDAGLRNLAAILAAEFAVASLYFAKAGPPKGPTGGILFLLGLLAIVLSISAHCSCRRSYRAHLESVVLIMKTVWAMGLTHKVSLADRSRVSPLPFAPVPGDSTFYIPRACHSGCEHKTTDEFVDAHLQARVNTYFWAKVTIWIFGVGATVIGFAAAIMVWTTTVAPNAGK